MKTLVIYDSVYGNTEKIAKVISDALNAKLLHVHDADPFELNHKDLVVIGSPVHGGRGTPELEEFINKIPKGSLKGVKVTTFDTRFSSEDHGIGLWLAMKVIRFAAGRLAKDLTKRGGILIAKPQGFIVKDKEGPLQQGEIERATEWAKSIKVLFA